MLLVGKDSGYEEGLRTRMIEVLQRVVSDWARDRIGCDGTHSRPPE